MHDKESTSVSKTWDFTLIVTEFSFTFRLDWKMYMISTVLPWMKTLSANLNNFHSFLIRHTAFIPSDTFSFLIYILQQTSPTLTFPSFLRYVFLYFNYQWPGVSFALAFFVTFVTLFSPQKHPQGILPQQLIRAVKLRLHSWCAICCCSTFTRAFCIHQVNIYWCTSAIMTHLPLLLSGALSVYRDWN